MLELVTSSPTLAMRLITDSAAARRDRSGKIARTRAAPVAATTATPHPDDRPMISLAIP